MTSLTQISLVSFVSSLVLVSWVSSDQQDDIKFIARQSMQFEVLIIAVAHPTLALAQRNYHGLQFSRCIRVKADM